MKTISASFFKANCLDVIKKVHATGEPVVVAERGCPIAQIVATKDQTDDLLGFMKGEFSITGDIESSIPSPHKGESISRQGNKVKKTKNRGSMAEPSKFSFRFPMISILAKR